MIFPSQIKAILFDLDGTLIEIPHYDTFFDDLLVESLRTHDILIPKLEHRLAVWHTGGNFEQNIRSWGVKDYDAFIRTFDQLDLDKRRKLIESGDIRPYSDIDVLDQLHAYVKLGLVSNTPPDIALLELQSFDLEQYFDDLVMLGTVEQHITKPEPDGILRCLKNLEVEKSQAVMVGDSSSDIIGGHRAGVSTVLVKRPNHPVPQNLTKSPHLVIDSLHQLLEFVK